MKQSVLDRAVARATGESLSVIRRLGFTAISPPASQRSYRPGRGRKQNRRGKLVAAGPDS